MTPEFLQQSPTASMVGVKTRYGCESDHHEARSKDYNDDSLDGSVLRGLLFGSLFSLIFYALGFAAWELVGR